MFRIILYSLLGYFIYNFFQKFKRKIRETTRKNKTAQAKRKWDIDNNNIEDAKFKDIKNDERNSE